MAAAAPMLLAATALLFLAVAGFSLLVRQIGLPGAALSFSAIFAVLALAALVLGRMRAEQQRRRAAAARAQLVAEIAAARALMGTAGALTPIAAFLVAFLLARRR
ncbi:MAG: hypothetical protein Q8P60_10055 [Pseudorhodobacter sp.]|nr:hypothetical protein [Pseudorhodobacter sp.]